MRRFEGVISELMILNVQGTVQITFSSKETVCPIGRTKYSLPCETENKPKAQILYLPPKYAKMATVTKCLTFYFFRNI